jgi:hypothetical protein
VDEAQRDQLISQFRQHASRAFLRGYWEAILHVVLLPLNGWPLMGALKQHNAIVVGHPSVPLRPVADFIAD